MERLEILVGRLYKSVGPTKYVKLVGRFMALVFFVLLNNFTQVYNSVLPVVESILPVVDRVLPCDILRCIFQHIWKFLLPIL